MFEVSCDWTNVKSFAQNRGLSIQYVDFNGNYYLSVIDKENNFSVGMIMSQEDPNNSDLQDFENNFKALGNTSFRSGQYATFVNIRQTAATAANATVFSFRNPANSEKNIYIEKINLVHAFDSATPVTPRSTLRYRLQGFGGATPSGGTTQTPAKLDSAMGASVGPDIRYLDTGLTTTGVSFGGIYSVISCPACDGSLSVFSKKKEDYVAKLYAGEGFCFRLENAAIAGQSLCGEIIWSER